MIIFIDESGDAGFRTDKGSSKTFVIGLIIFDDELEAEETALKIKKIRREIGKSDHFEFKFNKCNKVIRTQFFEKIKNSKFRVRAIVIQKEKIHSPILRGSKEKFYNYVIKTVLQNNNETIENAKIRLDGLGEKLFKNSLNTYLRKNLNDGNRKVVQNLRFRDSKSDVLIQLADMIVGAINRSYDSAKTDHQYYIKIIKRRIEDIWEFE
jgi:hypothetical protein